MFTGLQLEEKDSTERFNEIAAIGVGRGSSGSLFAFDFLFELGLLFKVQCCRLHIGLKSLM